MGYYIQGPNRGKADFLLAEYPEFKEITMEEAEYFQCEEKMGIAVVVENGPFDAAAYVFTDAEFEDFTDPTDPRPKRFISGPRKILEEISGFNR